NFTPPVRQTFKWSLGSAPAWWKGGGSWSGADSRAPVRQTFKWGWGATPVGARWEGDGPWFWGRLDRPNETRTDGGCAGRWFLEAPKAKALARQQPVGKGGFEPPASTSRTWRAAKLRYFP